MRAIETMPVDSRIDQMAQQMRFLVKEAEERRQLNQAYSELMADLSPIASQGMSSLSQMLVDAEARGYVEFARSGFGVVDRAVTSFDEEDVAALGDNIVLILETVKEMTQPEIMQMLRSTLHQVQETDNEDEPPSLFALLRQLRTVEARRGLHRLSVALQSLGATTPESVNEMKEAQV